MHASNHALAALVVKKVIPAAPLMPLMLAVQMTEILWVVFHYAGVERTVIDEPMLSIMDVHFVHMPYSHSIFGALVVAMLFAAAGAFLWRKWIVALALALGAISHIALDLALHAPDIAIAPGIDAPMLGLGPYGSAPVLAFVLELGFGLAAWRFVGGGKWLLGLIILFNAIGLTFYVPQLHGSEAALAGMPMQMVTFVTIQIAATLPLTYLFAPKWMRTSSGSDSSAAGLSSQTHPR